MFSKIPVLDNIRCQKDLPISRVVSLGNSPDEDGNHSSRIPLPGGFKAQPVPSFIRKRKEQAKQSLRVLSTSISKQEKKTPKVAVGDVVGFTTGGKKQTGLLVFLGNTKFSEGEWCGIVLSEPVGKNDGAVLGVRYFECKSKHGIFLPIDKVKLVSRGPAGKEADAGSSENLSRSRSSSIVSVESSKGEVESNESSSTVSVNQTNEEDMKTVVTREINLNGRKRPLTVKIGEGTRLREDGTEFDGDETKSMIVFITGHQGKKGREPKQGYQRSSSFTHPSLAAKATNLPKKESENNDPTRKEATSERSRSITVQHSSTRQNGVTSNNVEVDQIKTVEKGLDPTTSDPGFRSSDRRVLSHIAIKKNPSKKAVPVSTAVDVSQGHNAKEVLGVAVGPSLMGEISTEQEKKSKSEAEGAAELADNDAPIPEDWVIVPDAEDEEKEKWTNDAQSVTNCKVKSCSGTETHLADEKHEKETTDQESGVHAAVYTGHVNFMKRVSDMERSLQEISAVGSSVQRSDGIMGRSSLVLSRNKREVAEVKPMPAAVTDTGVEYRLGPRCSGSEKVSSTETEQPFFKSKGEKEIGSSSVATEVNKVALSNLLAREDLVNNDDKEVLSQKYFGEEKQLPITEVTDELKSFVTVPDEVFPDDDPVFVSDLKVSSEAAVNHFVATTEPVDGGPCYTDRLTSNCSNVCEHMTEEKKEYSILPKTEIPSLSTESPVVTREMEVNTATCAPESLSKQSQEKAVGVADHRNDDVGITAESEWPQQGQVSKRKALFDQLSEKTKVKDLSVGRRHMLFIKERSKSWDHIHTTRPSLHDSSQLSSSMFHVNELERHHDDTHACLSRRRSIPAAKRKIVSAKMKRETLRSSLSLDHEHGLAVGDHSKTKYPSLPELRLTYSDSELKILSEDLDFVAVDNTPRLTLENSLDTESLHPLPAPSPETCEKSNEIIGAKTGKISAPKAKYCQDSANDEEKDESGVPTSRSLDNGDIKQAIEERDVCDEHSIHSKSIEQEFAVTALDLSVVESEVQTSEASDVSSDRDRSEPEGLYKPECQDPDLVSSKPEKKSALPKRTGIPKITSRISPLTSSPASSVGKPKGSPPLWEGPKSKDTELSSKELVSKDASRKAENVSSSTRKTSLDRAHKEEDVSSSSSGEQPLVRRVSRVGDLVSKIEKEKQKKSTSGISKSGKKGGGVKGPNEATMGNKHGIPYAKSVQNSEELAAKEFLSQKFVDKHTSTKSPSTHQNGSTVIPKTKGKGKESKARAGVGIKGSSPRATKMVRSTSLASDTSSYVSIPDNQRERNDEVLRTHEKLKNQVNELRSSLSSKHRTLEALAVVIQHYTTALECEKALSCALRTEKADLQQKMADKDLELAEVAKQVDRLQDQVSAAQFRHGKDLEELKTSMRSKHERHIDEVSSEYHEELENLRESHAEEIQELNNSLQEKLSEGTQELMEQHSKEMETVVSDYEEKLEELKIQIRSLSSDKDALNKEVADLQRKKDSRSPYPVPEYDLPAELESLQAVLEIKKDEIKDLRQQNMEMKKKVEDYYELQREHEKTMHEKEALKVALENKSKFQRQISVERDSLAATLEEQSRKVMRLSMENEELMWKVAETNLSTSTPSLNNNFSPTKHSTPRSPTSPLPKKLKRLSLNLPTLHDEFPYS